MRQTPSSPGWFHAPVRAFNEARSLVEAALAYARVGLPIFPIEPQGKRPLVAHGVYAATCEPRTIQRWWRRWPRANIGMPTGQPSGCWVLDVDPRHGGLESLEQLQRDALPGRGSPGPALDATRIQLTGGGGVHLCYHLREGLEEQFSNAVHFAGYPGLDLRVAGGSIVVAPSRHTSGDVYRWHNELPPAPFPLVLIERWRAHRQRAFARRAPNANASFRHVEPPGNDRERDPQYWLRCALTYGVPGRRHNYALFLAFHLLDDAGMRPEQAEEYMLAYARHVSQAEHPFTADEALDCLYWAARRRGMAGMG
jgi:hypothetical protein